MSAGYETDMPWTLHMCVWFFRMRGTSVSDQEFSRSAGVLVYPWIKASGAREKLTD